MSDNRVIKFLMLFVSFLRREKVCSIFILGPKKSLVPKKPASGCPTGTHPYSGTCCCEDGCCWDKCTAADPNNHGDCLKGTGAKWVRNDAAGAWRAQVISKLHIPYELLI